MSRIRSTLLRCAAALPGLIAAAAFPPASAVAQPSPREIKIGQTTAFSGPFSAWSVSSRVQAAYFASVNERGGINGRRVNLISLDDGYSPPKTVEQTRKLVEDDEVLFILSSLGAASNSAIHRYLNSKKVPQLFPVSGASKWADPANFPWTMGWMPTFAKEGAIYARHILETRPDAKIAVFYQNDDFGRDYLKGFEEALGPKAKQIVAKASYIGTDPTVDSQIVQLKGSGAEVLFNASSPKFAAQAIKKMAELSWSPVHILVNPSSSISSVLKPAGLEISKGIISATYLKDPANPALSGDGEVQEYKALLAKYAPGVDAYDANAVWGYASAGTIANVLKQCGDDLSRENILKQAAGLRDVSVPMLLSGIRANTSATDYEPLEEEQLVQFDGAEWKPFGPVVSGRK